ncbi:MAG TPA: hypothetical protein VEB18_02080 [Candidatus Paceibacterota bacterium]|nr:hypothetical protein [Candidatus Paceibacterota bacterium]
MKAKNISYPYPVLGNEDDVKGTFDVSFKHALRREEVALMVGFKLKNKSLEKLVKEKKAAFTVEVECPGTFFRKSFSTFEHDARFVIGSGLVREHVSAAFYVRAVEPLPKYKIDGSHPDYEGFPFDIGAGDVLALGGHTSFIAEKDFDPMRPAVSSLIAIKPGTHAVGPMQIDYSQDKILIKLSERDYKNYGIVKGRVGIAGVLHASIVLPVLAEAIKLVHEKDHETQGTHWHKRLEIILRQQELPADDGLLAAQKLLRSPLERCLSGLAEDSDD